MYQWCRERIESAIEIGGLGSRELISRLIPKGGFLRNVTMLAGGTALAQGITVLVSPLLTRIYVPSEMGVFSVFVSILAILVCVASWRYEVTIPLPEDDSSAANLLVLSLVIVMGMAAAIGVAVWIIGNQASSWGNLSAIAPYLWLLPIGFVGAGAYQALSYWPVRKRSYRPLVQTKLSQSIGQAVTQIILGVLGMGPIGLLLGDIVGRASGSYRLGLMFLKQNRNLKNTVSIKSLLQIAARYRRFPLLSSWATLLNTIGLLMPTLILAGFYGTRTAGLLSLAQMVLGGPLNLLRTSIAQVYLGDAAKLGKENLAAQESLFLKTTKRVSIVGFPIVAAIALCAPLVFGMAFGSAWAESATFLQILAPMYFFYFVGSPLAGALDVFERQDIHLTREVIRTVLVVGALLGSGFLGLSAKWSLAAFSATGSVFYVFYVFTGWFAITAGKDSMNPVQAEKAKTTSAKRDS